MVGVDEGQYWAASSVRAAKLAPVPAPKLQASTSHNKDVDICFLRSGLFTGLNGVDLHGSRPGDCKGVRYYTITHQSWSTSLRNDLSRTVGPTPGGWDITSSKPFTVLAPGKGNHPFLFTVLMPRSQNTICLFPDSIEHIPELVTG